MAGNEIIETQTYYTQPEDDWEFDENQKLSYNNPVFIEQLKRSGKKVEELDTGWVPQVKIGDIKDEEEDEELEDDWDDEEEDEIIPVEKPQRPLRPTKPIKANDVSNIEEDDDEEDIMFSFGKNDKPKTENKSAQPTNDKPEDIASKIVKPEISMADLESMFGTSTSETTSSTSIPKPNMITTPETSTRNKVENALKSVDEPKSNHIKLNIDKTASVKQTIKLNIKQK